MVSFLSLSGMVQPGNIPSPRYWLLWPVVMIMVCYYFAEMLSHWRVIWVGMLYIWANLKVAGQTVQVSWEKRLNSHRGQAAIFSVTSVEGEPRYSEPEEQTSAWVWGTGCLVVLILSCVIFEVQSGISWGKSLLYIPRLWKWTDIRRPRDLVLHSRDPILLSLYSQQWGDRHQSHDGCRQSFPTGLRRRHLGPRTATREGPIRQHHRRCDGCRHGRHVQHDHQPLPHRVPSQYITETPILGPGGRRNRVGLPSTGRLHAICPSISERDPERRRQVCVHSAFGCHVGCRRSSGDNAQCAYSSVVRHLCLCHRVSGRGASHPQESISG